MLKRNFKLHLNPTERLDTHAHADAHAFGCLPSLSFLHIFALRAMSGYNFYELDHVYALFYNLLFKFKSIMH